MNKPPYNDNPYKHLADKPTFIVESDDVVHDQEMASAHRSGIFGAGGEDKSPHLRWEGFPPETKSFAVTVYDPDAPTGSGFWHWAVVNIPGDVTELSSGAGEPGGSKLPNGALQLRNDAGLDQYLGAAPPAGHGKHRYIIAVHALDVPVLEGVTADSSPAFLGFNLSGHTIALALMSPQAETV